MQSGNNEAVVNIQGSRALGNGKVELPMATTCFPLSNQGCILLCHSSIIIPALQPLRAFAFGLGRCENHVAHEKKATS